MIAGADISANDIARVEIDIFSGRPNPSWDLPPPDALELIHLLGAMRPTAQRPSADVGLGYRGFNIRVILQGQSREFHVSDASVTEGQRKFDDGNRMIERFLLSRIPAEIRIQLGAALPR